MIFSVLTGLKINLSKSTIIELGLNMVAVAQIAFDLGCRVDNSPFVYSGIPLEVEPETLVVGIQSWICSEEDFFIVSIVISLREVDLLLLN